MMNPAERKAWLADLLGTVARDDAPRPRAAPPLSLADRIKVVLGSGATRALDAGFKEGDHPRSGNGQFGSGSGGGVAKVKPKSGATEKGKAVLAQVKGSGTSNPKAAEKRKDKREARPESRQAGNYGPVSTAAASSPASRTS